MSDWLRRRPTWQFALTWDGIAVLAALATGMAVQGLWGHHLDLSSLLGSAAGCALGSTVMAVWYRQSQPRSRDEDR